MIKPFISKAAIAIILFGIAPAYANLRAPIEVSHQGSSTLTAPKQAQGLIVKAERLSFDMGAPYSGMEPVRSDAVRQVDIQAEYEIEALEDGDFAFAFIAADKAPARVQINDQAVAAEAPVAEIRPASTPGEKPSIEQWKIAFTGRLHKGSNTIKVQYLQPLSKQEIHYGYFTTSRWGSLAPYESGPLHEWQLADDFHLDITITAQEDSNALTRFIWGPRFEASIRQSDWLGSGPDTIQSSTANTRYQGGRLYYTISLGREFPDHIFAVIREVR